MTQDTCQYGAAKSAYIHIPFCRHHCGYCNFTVIANRDDLIDSYLSAIETELSWIGEPQSVDTLFFGGGTPTHLSHHQLERLFAIVTRQFPLANGGELSIEANPEDIDVEKAQLCAALGVNRVSLGIQSFQDDKLTTLERGHRGDDVARCVEKLRPYIENISLDLIFGAPNESLEDWRRDLARAIELAPKHVSTYGLTFEPGTQFHVRRAKQELQPLSEESESEMYETAIETLQSAGFDHYEVSNFAVPGFRCRHNENYWLCGEFFGFGPGASSYLGGVRRSNHRSTTTYLKKVLSGDSPVAEADELNDTEKAHERLVFGLRRLQGIDRTIFLEATGKDVDEVAGDNLAWLNREGLLDVNEHRVRLTRKGLLVSDSIWPYLL